MPRTLLARLLATLALALPAALPAAELEGQRFEEQQRLADRDLVLNGLGLRSVFIVKAYVAGLYLPEKARSAEQVLAQTGPRRLQMKLLMDTSAERFSKAFAEGLRENHTEAQLAALREPIAQLDAAMLAIGQAKKGDTITLDLAAGTTRLAVNGKPVGQPILAEGLPNAVLRVFLGDKPVDRKLKGGLLGGGAG